MKHIIVSLSALIVFGLAGCASTMSKNALVNVDRSVDITVVQANPTAFTGRKVVWGGVILSVNVLESSTEIEVLETRLGYDDVPEEGTSRGRFIIESIGFLDPNIFKTGLGITVAGHIKGAVTAKIGKMDYHYPVVTPLEIKTFDMSKPLLAPPYPYRSPWYDPYNPWHRPYDPLYAPYYGPYYSPYYDPFYGP